MTTPEPLTPLAVEAKLRQLVTDLSRAQIVLREARDAEVDARHEHDRAHRRALLSEKSPKVTRGGYTTADRDAWVDEQVADLRFASDKATVVREAAQDRIVAEWQRGNLREIALGPIALPAAGGDPDAG